MIKAVIFDIDDTVCNTSQAVYPALAKVFEDNLAHFPGKTVEEMLALDQKAFKELFHHPEIPIPSATILIWFKVFEYLNLNPPVKPIYRMIRQFREEYMKHLNVYEGLEDLLIELKKQNVKIGALTNGTFMEQARKLILLNLDGYIDYLVSTDMSLIDKPHKKTFQYVLDKLSVETHEAVMIGDLLPIDIIGAHNAGLKTIWFTKENNSPKPIEADKIISSYKNITANDIINL